MALSENWGDFSEFAEKRGDSDFPFNGIQTYVVLQD